MSEGSEHPDDVTADDSSGPFTYAHGTPPPPAANAELTPPPGGGADRTDPTLASSSTDATSEHTPGGGSWGSLAEGADVLQGKPQPGQTLFGRYLVERQIGEGGMGAVYLVRHLELDVPRALKLIVAGIAFNPEAQARFKREARVMARLTHPNAVLVHDARMGRDSAFIEMEYVRGQSLNKLLKTGVPMPLGWTVRILEQLCDVLEVAHGLKIVHRDLKPANLMLVDGRPPCKEQLKVLDFGIAKILEGDEGSLDFHTKTECFVGSAPYSSPEQVTSGTLDVRSDLYSVGVILFEFLTGHRPFSGPITRLVFDHLYTPPPSFADRNPSAAVPAAVERLVLRCLAKDPAARPQTARELLAEFHAAYSCGTTVPNPSSSFSEGPPLSATEFLSPLAQGTGPQTEAYRLPGEIAPQPPTSYPEVTEEATRPSVADATQAIVREPFTPPSLSVPSAPPVIAPERPVGTLSHSTFTAPAAKPAPKSSRRLFLAVLIVLLAGAGLAAYYFAIRKPSVRLPEGYMGEGPIDPVSGMPAYLVRVSDNTRFIRIPGGEFEMGYGTVQKGSAPDEDAPAHPVKLSDFYIQEMEVTNGEMEAYFKAHKIAPSGRPKRWKAAVAQLDKFGRHTERYPAVGIPHDLAERYAASVGGLLPTEAQWEYAARSLGKLKRPFVWGDERAEKLTKSNIDSWGLLKDIPTVEVGYFPKGDRTEQGVLDMGGNVREWCRDVYGMYPDTDQLSNDPRGPDPPEEGKVDYVIRGSSWSTYAEDPHTRRPRHADQNELTHEQLAVDGSAEDLGFRVVLEWPPRP